MVKIIFTTIGEGTIKKKKSYISVTTFNQRLHGMDNI